MSQAAAPTRRTVLGMLGAGAALGPWPAIASAKASSGDIALRQALDQLAALPNPAAKLHALAGFDPRGLSPSPRLDLQIVRRGLTLDGRLAALGPTTPSYPLLLQRACGTVISPPEAASLLAARIHTLTARAEDLFAKLAIPGAKLGDKYRALFADPQYHYRDDAKGRGQAVADMNRWLDTARAQLPRWFAPLPAACVNVSVEPLSATDIAAGKPGYRLLAEGGNPGHYFVDLRDIARRPSWSLRSVVHHELLPGHMVQMPLEKAANPHPLRLHYASAFNEGWAIYGEVLAWRAGLFAGAAEELGTLHWLLFRASRGMADIGLHGLGWSDQAARDFMAQRLGSPAYFATFEADIASIKAHPAQRCAEALTAYALAEAAKNGGGIRKFHQQILACGSLQISQISNGFD